ncbi:hypothetical protein [Limnohabitans sp. Rim8]|uniref:hypothetical protein n=1 Tax=Limnohabitans sp. Rim8 TaxID=1100718 RepID=UPI0025D4C116|nr:hypothetical protein [Limnohabitans sp. Rim8]
MTEMRKRGRPKHWLNDPPEHIKELAGIPDPVTDQILKNAEQLERFLRKGEPRGVPTHLLAELNDFDDLTPERKRTVLVDYRKQKFKIDNARQDGANTTKQKAHERGLEICNKNKSLIQRIKPNGHLTVHGVAKRIHDEWSERGDSGMAPSINTLSTYIKKHQQRQE